MLGHEGSALMLLPMAAYFLFTPRRWPPLRVALAGVAVAVALVVPWTLYQHYYDPPGTGLTKLQLAGSRQAGSLTHDIFHAYGRLDAGQILGNKLDNLAYPFSGEPGQVRAVYEIADNLVGGGSAATHRTSAAATIRTNSFLFVWPSLGLIGLALFAQLYVLWRRRHPLGPLIAANRLWVVVILSWLFWSAILFGPNTTWIHAGTYALELFIYAAAAVALSRIGTLLIAAIAIFQGIVNLLVYGVIQVTRTQMASPIGSHLIPGEVLLVIVGLALVIVLPLIQPRFEVDDGDRAERRVPVAAPVRAPRPQLSVPSEA
jgi:hypothetical protein